LNQTSSRKVEKSLIGATREAFLRSRSNPIAQYFGQDWFFKKKPLSIWSRNP